jgi:quinol-cytochrome oxidoreductase complex cytochrome b subunit
LLYNFVVSIAAAAFLEHVLEHEISHWEATIITNLITVTPHVGVIIIE